jgi:hypothetical protein
LHGEAASVDHVNIAKNIADLQTIIASYDPEIVHNMDETGLNYRLLPNRSYIHQSERIVRGSKAMRQKDRVTVYVATNATGSDKIPLSIIHSVESPRCFDYHQHRLKYFVQKKGWSDTATFTKWVKEVFLPHIRAKTDKKVLLIMDNSGPHGAASKDDQGQVELVHLPPNCTAAHQPMYQGIIHALKKNYRYTMLNLRTWTSYFLKGEQTYLRGRNCLQGMQALEKASKHISEMWKRS